MYIKRFKLSIRCSNVAFASKAISAPDPRHTVVKLSRIETDLSTEFIVLHQMSTTTEIIFYFIAQLKVNIRYFVKSSNNSIGTPTTSLINFAEDKDRTTNELIDIAEGNLIDFTKTRRSEHEERMKKDRAIIDQPITVK